MPACLNLGSSNIFLAEDYPKSRISRHKASFSKSYGTLKGQLFPNVSPFWDSYQLWSGTHSESELCSTQRRISIISYNMKRPQITFWSKLDHTIFHGIQATSAGFCGRQAPSSFFQISSATSCGSSRTTCSSPTASKKRNTIFYNSLVTSMLSMPRRRP